MGFIIENSVVEILYGSLLAFWIIYLYFVKDYGYWEQRNVPHVPAVFPFGSLSKIVTGKCYWGIAFDEIYKEFKDEPYVGCIDIRSPCLVIRDPKLIKLILKDNFNHFMNHYGMELHPKDYMVQHLYNMKGQEWKEMRVKLTPAYTASKMKMMFCLVKECSDILRDHVRKLTVLNNVIDVKDILSRFTMDIIGSCAFGIEINSLTNKNSQFYKVARKVMNIDFTVLSKYYIFNAFPVFSKVYCFDFFDPKIKEFLTDIIRATVECREKHNISRCDFLDLFIKLRQNQSILEEGEKPVDLHDNTGPEKREGLTIEEITAEAFLFLVAGYEFTSNVTQFCLYELACNRHVQERLYREVREVLDRHEDISYQALHEMAYMDQVINESIRRYPVFPQLQRTCTENYRVPNSTFVIEKDMRIVIPTYSLNHDPEYFPDPYTFDPERFDPKNCKDRHPFVFLPFGEGPRMCIGFRFGLIKVKTALATLISDYEVSLTPDTEVPLQIKGNAFTTLPLKPLMLAFNKR